MKNLTRKLKGALNMAFSPIGAAGLSTFLGDGIQSLYISGTAQSTWPLYTGMIVSAAYVVAAVSYHQNKGK
jgi:hypothetical protein